METIFLWASIILNILFFGAFVFLTKRSEKNRARFNKEFLDSLEQINEFLSRDRKYMDNEFSESIMNLFLALRCYRKCFKRHSKLMKKHLNILGSKVKASRGQSC